MFVFLFILTITFIPGSLSQGLTKDHCYERAKNEFNRSLPDPPKFSIPDEFENIKLVIDQIKIVISQIGNTDVLRTKLNNSEGILQNINEQLKLISTGNDLLENLKESAEKLEKLKAFNRNTKELCAISESRYKKLKKEIEEINKKKPEIDDTIAKIKERIDRINSKSTSIKNQLNRLIVPDYFSDKYLCDNDIFKLFQEMKKTAYSIKNELENMRDKLISELKQLKKKLELKNTKEDLPEIPFTVAQLQTEIKYFKSKLKVAKKLRNLLEKKKKAEEDFNSIKNIALELCKNEVCIIQTSVHVEQ